MRMSASGTHTATPMKMVAAAAAAALLAVPLQAAAQGPGRTALLGLTDGASLAQLADSVVALGGRVVQRLDVADALLVELPRDAAVPAGATEIPDKPMRVNGAAVPAAVPSGSAPTYRATIGAPADPTLGAGVTVALVDTGVATHAEGLDDVQRVAVEGVKGTGDGYGHGTFLAGIIGGSGRHPGVAPGATLLDVRVADQDGSTSLARVLSGLQAVSARADVDVVSLSLSSSTPLPPGFDPLARALERLWGQGITVVVAAGNDGEDGWNSVGSPGSDPVLITAGALDEAGTDQRSDDTVAPFSSRGSKHAKEKPDIVAPGVSLVSTAAKGSVASEVAGWVVDGYMPGSGTSMSAAVVAGAAAAVLGANTGLRPNGVKALLTSTTYGSKDLQRKDGAGAGALDLGAALAAAPSAPADAPNASGPASDGDWGPAEDDAAAWDAFSAAWDAQDKAAVKAAWAELSWQTQQWASRMWMLAVLADSVGLSNAEFVSRAWASRAWAFDSWLSRAWASRAWASRAWAFDEWLSRAWASRAWASRAWAADTWDVDEWLSRAWASRAWASRAWASRAWASRAWASRAWAEDEWASRAWASRAWASGSWGSRAWASRAWAASGKTVPLATPQSRAWA